MRKELKLLFAVNGNELKFLVQSQRFQPFQKPTVNYHFYKKSRYH